MLRLVLGLLVALTCACTGELMPLGDVEPPPEEGADAAIETVLAFKPRIQTDLDTLGCTTGDCHALLGTPMTVTATPGDDIAWMANYDQVMPRTGAADTSLLIAKPTGAGGHLVVVQATSPVLARWREWIEDGAPYE